MSTLKTIAVVLVALILCIAGFLGYIQWRYAHRERMRSEALPVTVSQAAPVIEAILQYSRDHGAPPPSLEAVVPRYLKQLPDAGPIAENGWHYTMEEDADAGGWSLLVWVRDEYSPNVLGFGDRFVFRPSGKYPKYAYGGVLVLFGRWGYYIE